MSFVIRLATPADLRPAAAMLAQAWRESYQGLLGPSTLEDLSSRSATMASRWSEQMGDGRQFWVVQDDQDQAIVGLGHAEPARDDDAPQPVELTMLYLLERALGHGIADELLEKVLDEGPAYLWVLQGNARSEAFYAKMGFVADGAVRPVEEMQGATELRMVRAR